MKLEDELFSTSAQEGEHLMLLLLLADRGVTLVEIVRKRRPIGESLPQEEEGNDDCS